MASSSRNASRKRKTSLSDDSSQLAAHEQAKVEAARYKAEAIKAKAEASVKIAEQNAAAAKLQAETLQTTITTVTGQLVDIFKTQSASNQDFIIKLAAALKDKN